MENRGKEILRTVDEMLRRIQRWLNDPYGGPIMPENVGLSIQAALQVCDAGNIPASCRDLATVAVPRLAEECRAYAQREHGKVRPESGAPGPSFWASVKTVAKARAAAETPVIEKLEPVAVLLQQGVTHDQIARHIYGRRGVGPFLQVNGATNIALMEQEATQPGSVIAADWVPPWHRELLDRRQQDLELQLSAYDQQELARHYDDPATVEEMLRDGAFVQQIERAKGTSRDEILEVARTIGVSPIDGPGYRPGVRDAVSEFDEDDSGAASAADRQALKGLVIEMYSQSNCTRGAADIATELRKLGHDINTNAVSATIGHWKRKNGKAVATT
ncbi:MAG: hypothetical protein U0941_26520 [Planctomycetaceae bacterium]